MNPSVDTLFKLCVLYKTSKMEIQRVNGFSGDEIFFMKEIFIPYKNQDIVFITPDPNEEGEREQEA